MPIDDRVREHRQERISQLLDHYLPKDQLADVKKDAMPPQQATKAEPDPELWWKEREKQRQLGSGIWQGVKGLPPSSPPQSAGVRRPFGFYFFIRGFMWRSVWAVLLFAAIWGWLKLEMPASMETRGWVVDAVTRDMDFEAIEAWYTTTFDGSPSFFSFHQDKADTKEVAVQLNPEQTMLPVQGEVVQSFAQNGTGVKVATAAGSEVLAIFTGRVRQVAQDQEEGFTVLVQHADGVMTVYGHMDKPFVKPNDWVKTGQPLGELADTGNAWLYFAVQQNGKAIDPADVVDFD